MAVPAAPRLRGYRLSAGKLALKWLDVPGATSYNLYRGGYRDDYLLVGDERQKIAVQATGGTFRVTFSAQQTAALAFDITAANLKIALDGLSSITSVSVERTTVAGGFDFIVTFDGTGLARTNVAAMTTDATSLTGGAQTAVVSTLTAGGPYDDDVESGYVDSVAEGTQKAYQLRAVNGDGESEPSNIVMMANRNFDETDPDTSQITNALRVGGRVIA